MDKRLYPSAALHGRVAHEIGRQIVSGAIAEGDFLPREAELSERFDVSRQAVREGLKVLAAKGLVGSRRRAGTYVLPRASWNLLDPDVLAWHPPAELDPAFINDLVELRRVIEPAAVEMAASRADAAGIDGIGKALRRMQESVDDAAAYAAADAEFHMAIFAASGNALVERLSHILGPLLAMSIQTQGRFGLDRRESLAMHAGIYEAIVGGDFAGAKAALDGVLGQATSEVAQLMEERQAARGKRTAA
jgi:DNA-binding FadR family transcriptional regulator